MIRLELMMAAQKALVKAVEEPGSLIRVTFDKPGDVLDTVSLLVDVATSMGLNPESNRKGEWPILELKNGSGIELVFDVDGLIQKVKVL